MDRPDFHLTKTSDRGVPGDVRVADSVRRLALGKGFSFEDGGAATLEVFQEPVRLWRVRANG